MLFLNPQKIDESEVISMAKAACHGIDHIYLHWTAGHYGQAYDDYHLNIERDGKHDINDTMLFTIFR